jgi:hypothetical protein
MTKIYTVEVSELLRRTYVVTTPGDEARAAELAEEGDYGVTGSGETVKLLEGCDLVCDFSIIGISCEDKEVAT